MFARCFGFGFGLKGNKCWDLYHVETPIAIFTHQFTGFSNLVGHSYNIFTFVLGLVF